MVCGDHHCVYSPSGDVLSVLYYLYGDLTPCGDLSKCLKVPIDCPNGVFSLWRPAVCPHKLSGLHKESKERTNVHTNHLISELMYLLTYILTYTNTNIPTYLHTHILPYILTYMLTYLHTYLHTHILTYLHTYLHTYIHIYLHTDLHTDLDILAVYRLKSHIRPTYLQSFRQSWLGFSHWYVSCNGNTDTCVKSIAAKLKKKWTGTGQPCLNSCKCRQLSEPIPIVSV